MAACSSIVKKAEKRISICPRCDHDFIKPYNLYKHLFCSKIDCNSKSNISIEEARENINIPEHYKCKHCNKIIINIEDRNNHLNNCEFKDIIDTIEINKVDPILSYLFASDENGKIITNIDKETGYIDATIMCKSVNKKFTHYFENNSTKELINTLQKYSKKNNTEILNSRFQDSIESLIFEKTYILNPKVKHTYVHETIAIDLAGWCSVEYKIIVYNHIINYRNGLIRTEDSKKAKQDIEDIENGKKELYVPVTCLDCIDMNCSQFYFRFINMSSKDVEMYDTKGKRVVTNYIIMKGGSQGEDTKRQKNHESVMKTSSLTDSIKCYKYLKLEKHAKEKARELNMLCNIKSPENYKGDEYYVFKTQEEYNNFVLMLKEKAKQLNNAVVNELTDEKNKEYALEMEKEKTKQKELENENIKLKIQLEEKINKQTELKLQLKLNKKEKNKIEKYTISSDENNNMYEKIMNKNDFKFEEYKKIFKGMTTWKGDGITYYRVTLCHDKKRLYLGSYNQLKLACIAYDCKCKLLKKEIYYGIEIPNGYSYDEKRNVLCKII
jgi:KilA-N domain